MSNNYSFNSADCINHSLENMFTHPDNPYFHITSLESAQAISNNDVFWFTSLDSARDSSEFEYDSISEKKIIDTTLVKSKKKKRANS